REALGRDALERPGRAIERRADRRALFVDGGLKDSLRFDAVIVEHPLVAHPVLVDRHVLARPVAVHLAVARVVVEERVTAGRAALAHGARAAKEPDSCLESKI